jgi:hypothetical protein
VRVKQPGVMVDCCGVCPLKRAITKRLCLATMAATTVSVALAVGLNVGLLHWINSNHLGAGARTAMAALCSVVLSEEVAQLLAWVVLLLR